MNPDSISSFLLPTRRFLRRVSTILLVWSVLLSPGISAQVPAPSSDSAISSRVKQSMLGVTASTTELRNRISEIIHQREFSPALLSIAVVSLENGRMLYEENAEKLMSPASNMKLYTIAAALDLLSPNFRFKTSVYARQRPDSTGKLSGDLVIYGRGDPTFSSNFNGGDYSKAIDDLAARIKAAGVRVVSGDLVGDESYFTGQRLAPGWAWDDTQWYYGVEVSALSVGDNSVSVSIGPGASVGDKSRISVEPQTPLIKVSNRVVTSAHATRRDIRVNRRVGEDLIELSGSIPEDDSGYTETISVSHAALRFTNVLRSSLARLGVKIVGQNRVIETRMRDQKAGDNFHRLELASRESPPLSVIADKTLKESQNLYAELILRALGAANYSAPNMTTAESGLRALKQFLAKAGIDTDRLVLLDGSGLSRGTLVSTQSLVRLLAYMNGHRDKEVFRNALSLAGVDGTLRSRFRGTAAAGNVQAKTGAIGPTVSLSGYVRTAAGERLAFSMIINNTPPGVDPRAQFTDAVTALLAAFAGHS